MVKNFVYSGLLSGVLLLLTACSSTHTTQQIGMEGVEQDQNSLLGPNRTAASYNVQLGMGYFRQGDVQRAKTKFLMALAQAPDWAPTQDAMGYFMEMTGDPQSAEKYYLKAIRIDPNAGSTQNNYGTFLCRVGRYQEADQHFMLAVQDINYINTAEAYENAGLCAMQIPDNAKAIAYFQKAILQDPRRATSFLELGQLNYQQENIAQAQQYFARYMQLVKEPGPEALWLGVRLARSQGDKATAANYTLQLQTQFPSSAEYQQLRASQSGNKQLTAPDN